MITGMRRLIPLLAAIRRPCVSDAFAGYRDASGCCSVNASEPSLAALVVSENAELMNDRLPFGIIPHRLLAQTSLIFPGVAVDDIDERRQAERFEEIGTGAPNQLFRLPGISGHKHDGDVLPVGFESDLPVRPVRQHAIEQHEVDSIAEQMIDRLRDIGSANDLVGVAEHIGDNCRKRFLVFHH